MGAFARVTSWFRAAGSRNRLELEMEEELSFHIDARVEALKREGMSEREAYRRARIEMGSIETHKDGMRSSLGLRWWDDLWADVRYALRVLRRSPGFTAVAVGSLALAIGANTAIFSFANEVLYERLGVAHPEQLRLLVVHDPPHGMVHSSWGYLTGAPDGSSITNSLPYPIFEALRRDNRSLQDLFSFKDMGRANITVHGEARSVDTELVSGNYYQQLQVQPQLGRPILPSDDNTSTTNNVLLISDGFWTRAFARDPHVLGKIILVNTLPFTVVGVNPKGFTGAREVQSSPDIFLPLSMINRIKGSPSRGHTFLDSPDFWWTEVMGRIKPKTSRSEAEAALNVSLEAALRSSNPPKKDEHMPRLVLEDCSRGAHPLDNKFGKPLHVLMTMTAFVLLLACANLANLVLARAATRRREMGVRLALGASASRLLRQVLTENLTLASIGGLCGLALGYVGSSLLPRLTLNAWEDTDLHVPFNWKVFVFTATITILTGILCGIAPALAATRTVAVPALRDASTSSPLRRKGLTGKFIVGFQIAVSTLLVAGAALFLRTLWTLNHIDPGFRADHLLLFELDAPSGKYPPPLNLMMHVHMEQALRTVPGVLSVTASDIPLLADSVSNSSFEIEGRTRSRANDLSTERNDGSSLAAVGNEFLRTLEIPIERGRSFGSQDTEASTRVSVINRSLAKRFFPNEDPIGRRFRTGSNDPWTEIIGISGDIRYANMREAPPPLHFDLYRQDRDIGTVTYMIRTTGSPFDVVPSVRQAIGRIDRNLPMMSVRTQQQQINAALQQEHIFASLTTGFGLLALALACVGIYGMMAYGVAQRTQEIGLRLALGAPRIEVCGMVLREATGVAVSGVAIGLLAVFFLARLVRSMLYGLGPTDPLSLGGAAAVLLLVALLSAWGPSLRAARMQPLDALRHE